MAKQKDTIARQRYESGCLMVVASLDKTQLTAITEGMPAFTNDRNLIANAAKRYRGMRYTMPSQR